MATKTTTEPEDTRSRSIQGRGQASIRSRLMRNAVFLLAVLVAAVVIYRQSDPTDLGGDARNNLYMPVVDPILENDRPDLIGESLPDE